MTDLPSSAPAGSPPPISQRGLDLIGDFAETAGAIVMGKRKSSDGPELLALVEHIAAGESAQSQLSALREENERLNLLHHACWNYFGISTPEQVSALSAHIDNLVVAAGRVPERAVTVKCLWLSVIERNSLMGERRLAPVLLQPGDSVTLVDAHARDGGPSPVVLEADAGFDEAVHVTIIVWIDEPRIATQAEGP